MEKLRNYQSRVQKLLKIGSEGKGKGDAAGDRKNPKESSYMELTTRNCSSSSAYIAKSIDIYQYSRQKWVRWWEYSHWNGNRAIPGGKARRNKWGYSVGTYSKGAFLLLKTSRKLFLSCFSTSQPIGLHLLGEQSAHVVLCDIDSFDCCSVAHRPVLLLLTC